MAENQILTINGHSGSGGVGAVVLDGGADFYAGLNQELGRRIDVRMAQERAIEAAEAKEKRARANALIANLKYNPDGIRSQETDLLANEYGGNLDKASKLLAQYNGDVPQSVWMKEIEVPQGQLLSRIEKSKAINKLTQDATAAYTKDPTKFDQETYEQAIARIQSAPLDEAVQLAQQPILAPYQNTLDELISERMKGLALKPKSTDVTYEKGAGGRDVAIEREELMTPQEANNYAQSFSLDPKYRRQLFKKWEATSPEMKQFYADKFKEFKQAGLPVTDEIDAFNTMEILKRNSVGQKFHNLGFTPERDEAAKAGAGKKSDLDAVRGLHKTLSKIAAGDEQFLGKDFYESRNLDVNDQPIKANSDGSLAAPRKRIEFTRVGGLDGTVLGQFTQDVKTANGVETKSTDNVIQKAIRLDDGRIGVFTTKSIKEYGDMNPAQPMPYDVYNSPYELGVTIFNNEPDAAKRDKGLGYFIEVENEFRNKYGNDYEGWIGMTEEGRRKRDEKLGQSYTESIKVNYAKPKPTEAVKQAPSKTSVDVLRSKSKSGKAIVSKDGGKTWQYE